MNKKGKKLLRAYRDTGLTPEQVKEIATILKDISVDYNIRFEYIIQLIMNAENVKWERDTAIQDIAHAFDCETCICNQGEESCQRNCYSYGIDHCRCTSCKEGSGWIWRGVGDGICEE